MSNKWKIWLLTAPIAVGVAIVAVRALTPSHSSDPEAFAAVDKTQTTSSNDSEAKQVLKKMSDYIGGLKSFRVESDSTDEVVTKSGQKIQIAASSRLEIERPNHLRSEQLVSPNALTFAYDGKSMTLYCKSSNTYATKPAPATIDATIDTVRAQYNADAPGADLLFSRPYDVLMEQVKGAGVVVGHEPIEGELATHLAFEGETVDWEIWVKETNQPLPVRYVITSKDVQNRPQFTIQLLHWEPGVAIADTEFSFEPPPNAKKVDAPPSACGKK